MTANIFPYDILGNIALVKFPKETKTGKKKKFAASILKKSKSIKTVLEKTKGFKGRLRKQETRWIAGEKTKEAIYRENNCVFRFNVDSTYFSPRLSNERKEIAGKIKKGQEVLVMFAGVAPFSIAIARNSQAARIYSNEINREANKYGEMNIILNKVKNKIVMLDGDVKKIAKKIAKGEFDVNAKNSHGLKSGFGYDAAVPAKFDVIVMPRPQLKETFLKQAFMLSKKGTQIFYYDFCKEDEINNVVAKINAEAKKAGKKIKISRVKKAGEIAAYRYRVRVDFSVL